jgi:hypothetical protein
VKSNTELYDMYHSPVKKRARVANIDDDELQRFMYASKEDLEGILSKGNLHRLC